MLTMLLSIDSTRLVEYFQTFQYIFCFSISLIFYLKLPILYQMVSNHMTFLNATAQFFFFSLCTECHPTLSSFASHLNSSCSLFWLNPFNFSFDNGTCIEGCLMVNKDMVGWRAYFCAAWPYNSSKCLMIFQSFFSLWAPIMSVNMPKTIILPHFTHYCRTFLLLTSLLHKTLSFIIVPWSYLKSLPVYNPYTLPLNYLSV